MSRIDSSNWKKFKVHELFETGKTGGELQVPTGCSVPRKDLLEEGETPRITVTGINNGVYDYYDYDGDRPDDYRVYENFISVSFLGTVFYQKDKASLDMKVHCLKPLDIELNEYIGLYLVAVLRATIRDGDYADQLSSTVLPHLEIQLPVDKKGKPDWKYMEEYMKNVEETAKSRISILSSIK